MNSTSNPGTAARPAMEEPGITSPATALGSAVPPDVTAQLGQGGNATPRAHQIGSVAGPFLAQAAGLLVVATVASLIIIGAAAMAFLTVPPMPATDIWGLDGRAAG